VNAKAVAEALRALAAAVEAPSERASQPVVSVAPPALDWHPIKACGLPERTVRLAVRKKEIGAARIGRDLYVDMASVRAFVEARRVDARADDTGGDEVDAAIAAKRLRLVGARGR
jgi:hypothetical protein